MFILVHHFLQRSPFIHQFLFYFPRQNMTAQSYTKNQSKQNRSSSLKCKPRLTSCKTILYQSTRLTINSYYANALLSKHIMSKAGYNNLLLISPFSILRKLPPKFSASGGTEGPGRLHKLPDILHQTHSNIISCRFKIALGINTDNGFCI